MAKVTKSKLAGKLGTVGQKAFAAHKDEPVKYGGGGDLPPGIDGGVAQLVECKFDIFKEGKNQGEYYFYAAGIVVSPETHNGIHIAGLRTSIMEPVCDTPDRMSRKSVDEHLNWVMNEMKKLGVDMTNLTIDDLEDTAAALKAESPYFRFRTWQGEPTKEFPNPRVQEQWRGQCEYDGDAAPAVDDNTGTTASYGTEEVPAEEPDAGGVSKNLESLGIAADEGDEDAQAKLQAMCDKVGLDSDEIATWAEVAEKLSAGASVADTGDSEGFVPTKEAVCLYRPPRARKHVECEVTAVFEGKQTCNLKNLDTGETYRSIAWSSLKAVDADVPY